LIGLLHRLGVETPPQAKMPIKPSSE
jgi:hypothetical protein